ncbi:hypothetical protein ACVIW3_004772 [Bradyrhizobium diazoefficiens]
MGDYARIVCRSHGQFEQLVSQHLRGAIGCSACKASARRLTTNEFVARAKKIHKAKFDYRGTNYIDTRTAIDVVCKKHGPFKVTPALHLRGAGGCIGCKTGRLTTEQFISRSKRLFPGKYDYAETSFTATSDSIRMICRTHGSFEQLAGNHLAGREGCAKCAYQNRFGFERQPHAKLSRRSERSGFELTKRRLSQEEFMKRAIAAHSQRYDLSHAVYRTQSDAVSVGCRQHGLFTIAAQNLWKGGGCPICSRAEQGMGRRLTTDEFVLRAKSVHGKKFKYGNTIYTTAKTKVSVTCAMHGDFSTLPSNHLAGRGCPSCSQERAVALLGKGARHSQDEVIARFKNVHGSNYRISTLTENAFRLNLEDRTLVMGRGRGWMGQTPWWTPTSGSSPEVLEFVRRTRLLLGRHSRLSRGGASQSSPGRNSPGASRDPYQRYVEAYEVEISPRHDKLQGSFERYLARAGATQVTPNVASVDLRYNDATRGLTFVEIKPCDKASARYAIRTAIGQLLDYRQRANPDVSLLIVLEAAPSHEDRSLATQNGFGVAYPLRGTFEVLWPTPS